MSVPYRANERFCSSCVSLRRTENCVPLIGNGGAYNGGNTNVVANEYSTPSSQSKSLTESGEYNEYKETPATPGRRNCHPKRKLRG